AGGWCAMSTHRGCPICARLEAVSDTCRYPTPFTYLRDATPPSPPTASSLGERVGVRGASASVLARASKRFRTPAGARATFSLLAQRESSQRETAPRWRALRPSMGSGCAGGFRGFSTARPCTGEKLARIHASHPADFPPPARRAIGAPVKAARSRRALARSRVAAAETGELIASVPFTPCLRWLPNCFIKLVDGME